MAKAMGELDGGRKIGDGRQGVAICRRVLMLAEVRSETLVASFVPYGLRAMLTAANAARETDGRVICSSGKLSALLLG